MTEPKLKLVEPKRRTPTTRERMATHRERMLRAAARVLVEVRPVTRGAKLAELRKLSCELETPEALLRGYMIMFEPTLEGLI